MVTYKSNLVFDFIVVLIIVFIINYIVQTILMKKKDHKIKLKSVVILLIQSVIISLLLYFV